MDRPLVELDMPPDPITALHRPIVVPTRCPRCNRGYDQSAEHGTLAGKDICPDCTWVVRNCCGGLNL